MRSRRSRLCGYCSVAFDAPASCAHFDGVECMAPAGAERLVHGSDIVAALAATRSFSNCEDQE